MIIGWTNRFYRNLDPIINKKIIILISTNLHITDFRLQKVNDYGLNSVKNKCNLDPVINKEVIILISTNLHMGIYI
jgi:hypothetical protein